MTEDDGDSPAFSFTELLTACDAADPPPPPIMIPSVDDGIDLAVRVYKPATKPRAVLIFYHGGGAHSGAGYQLVAQGLSRRKHGIIVYTPDLRGHGASGGPRGDAPSVDQVFRDISTVVEYAKGQHDTSLPLYLGGHSSGGGLMVNYAWDDKVVPAGYVLVSPQLGHLADIDRPVEKNSPPPFASVSILPFIMNGIFGWMGHNHAVKFRYTEEHLRDGGNVPSNTVNMANAITPTAPKAQFEQLNKSTDVVVSYQLVIGSDDELFVPEKVVAYAKPGHGEILEGENHLGILVQVHETIGAWMDQQLLVG